MEEIQSSYLDYVLTLYSLSSFENHPISTVTADVFLKFQSRHLSTGVDSSIKENAVLVRYFVSFLSYIMTSLAM